MKPLTRYKQYKNREPKDTIATIQRILKEKLNITAHERIFQERNGLFYSCRVLLNDTNDLRSANIGTNGKGMTVDYSRASAYGELMERLQNGVMFRKHIMKANAASHYMFTYDEDIAKDDRRLRESINKYVYSADNECLFELVKGKEHFYVPYYGVKEKKIVKLPFDIIYNNISTNGLCAGNTAKEAVIEGLSEIFERYVIRKIYFDNLSLPKIPRDYFKGNEILKRLEDLEYKEHYTIDIVDCSLNVGIPAVGVVVLTENRQEYQFHMGADPSPITALERSLTELFQGRDAIKFKQFDNVLQERLNTDLNLKEEEMNKTTSASTGHYPQAFFSFAPSYQFAGFDDRLGHSDDMDIQLMVELIEQLGFQLYVRDSSFLGFPAYSLYVPGMSELHNTHSLRYFKNTYNKDTISDENSVETEACNYKKCLPIIIKLQEEAICNQICQQSLKDIFL